MLLSYAALALALTPSHVPFTAALDLPEQLAWAAPARDVDRFVRGATRPDAVFARSLKPAFAGVARRLDHPTVYAVRATMEIAGDQAYVAVREGFVFTNPARVPLETLALRLLPSGQDAWSSGVIVRGVYVDGRPVEFALEDTILGVPLDAPLRPGHTARVLVDVVQRVPEFHRRPASEVDRLTPEVTGAYGAVREHDALFVNLGYWLPLLTPVASDGTWDVRRLPRNGEHTWFDPAMFIVALTVPSGFEVATTGVELERRTSDQQTTIVATASAVREFAVNVGEFDVAEVPVGGTTVRVHHRRDEAELGARLAGYATGALTFMEDTLGELPWRELDIVQTPVSVALGNEFPGLVTIDVGHDVAGYLPSEQHEWTVAHEVAHQWWYGAVGNDAQLEPWVDEALTSATAAMYWERTHGRDALEDLYRVDVNAPYRDMWERGVPDLPADLPGARYDLLQYGAVVYGKAVLFYDRVRREMGDAAFVGALRDHYDRHLLRDTTAADVHDTLMRHAAEPQRVDELYQRWIAGAHGFEDILGRTR